jgi:hypothetical protein
MCFVFYIKENEVLSRLVLGFLQMPFLYCVSSPYTDAHNLRKLGCTMCPVERMRQYNTGDPPGVGLEKRFDAIWEVRACDARELVRHEADVHTWFASARARRATGNFTEWFRVAWTDVAAFVVGQAFFVRQLTVDEVDAVTRRYTLADTPGTRTIPTRSSTMRRPPRGTRHRRCLQSHRTLTPCALGGGSRQIIHESPIVTRFRFFLARPVVSF